jgi:DNA-binding GntR family transcriptional regulator
VRRREPRVAAPAPAAPRPISLSVLAYQKFKERLLARDVRPGDFVSQRELSRLTGVPLGPMREALQKLVAERLVHVIPRRGIQVADANLKLIRNSFHLRIILEAEAARRFADAASDATIRELEQAHADIVERARTAITEPLLEDAQGVDARMHDSMVDGLGNEILSEVHRVNMDRIRLIRLDPGILTPANLVNSMKEHLAVIRACKRRDGAGSAHAMEVHLSNAMRRAMGI